MGVIYETSIYAFLFITVLGGGGAAFMIGRATAKGWRSFSHAVLYVMILSAALRFLHWGLFAGATLDSWRQAQGTLLSLHYYIADGLVLLFFAALGFQLQRASQMLRQYGWLVRKTSPFTWRLRENATMQPQSETTASSSIFRSS